MEMTPNQNQKTGFTFLVSNDLFGFEGGDLTSENAFLILNY